MLSKTLKAKPSQISVAAILLLGFSFAVLAQKATLPDDKNLKPASEAVAPVGRPDDNEPTTNPIAIGKEALREAGEAQRANALEIWNSVGKFDDAKKSNEEIDTREIEDLGERVIVEEIAEPSVEYRYASFGKPNPFVPPYQLGAKRLSSSNYEIPIVSPLQADLASLKVTGVWQLDGGAKRALILVANGQGIIASIGDPIGPAGKITEINDEGVITRQYKIMSDGSREYDDFTLPLKTEPEPTESLDGKYILEPGKRPYKQVDPPTDSAVGPIPYVNPISTSVMPRNIAPGALENGMTPQPSRPAMNSQQNPMFQQMIDATGGK